MKKFWLLVLWLCTIFFIWGSTQAKDYSNNLHIINNEIFTNTLNYNIKNYNKFSNKDKKQIKEKQNENNRLSDFLLFNIWLPLRFFLFIWIIFLPFIANIYHEFLTNISKSLKIFFIHIKIFILWIFNFSRLQDKIDLYYGKLKGDFAKKYPIIIQYNPPKWLNCAEVWFLLYRKVRTKDLFPLIYERKAKGLIDIRTDNKSRIIISRIHAMPSSYSNYEEKLFDVLVPYQTTILEKYISRNPKFDKESLEYFWIQKWWFTKKYNNRKNPAIFLVPIIVYSIISVIYCYISQDEHTILYSILGLPILIPIIFIFGVIIDKPQYMETELWAKLISQIIGYRKFLETCDTQKLKLFLEKDPSYFDKILPYATVFWLKNKLIKNVTPVLGKISRPFHNLNKIQYSNYNIKYFILIWLFIICFEIICLIVYWIIFR